MNDDPVTEELRHTADACFRQFNYIISAAFADPRRRTEQPEKPIALSRCPLVDVGCCAAAQRTILQKR